MDDLVKAGLKTMPGILPAGEIHAAGEAEESINWTANGKSAGNTAFINANAAPFQPVIANAAVIMSGHATLVTNPPVHDMILEGGHEFFTRVR
jgi:hypothetical protein